VGSTRCASSRVWQVWQRRLCTSPVLPSQTAGLYQPGSTPLLLKTQKDSAAFFGMRWLKVGTPAVHHTCFASS
jgi:hypothetical protein